MGYKSAPQLKYMAPHSIKKMKSKKEKMQKEFKLAKKRIKKLNPRVRFPDAPIQSLVQSGMY